MLEVPLHLSRESLAFADRHLVLALLGVVEIAVQKPVKRGLPCLNSDRSSHRLFERVLVIAGGPYLSRSLSEWQGQHNGYLVPIDAHWLQNAPKFD